MEWLVPLAQVEFGSEEETAVQEVLQRRWLTMGEITHAFEQDFAGYLGARHAIAVTNGTAALHLACLALGLTVGDEVILPSLTFVATAAAVCYVGATPVFADIESEQDLTVSCESIMTALTERSRAIVVMHYGGYACDMTRILDFAHKHGLFVIEDAAHAPGADLSGRKLGTWGDVGCFSFFSNKNLTTGEGGMLVTNNDDIAEKLRLLRSHGMTTLTWDRHMGHAWSYDVIALGHNYRIDEMRAAIGRVQLRRLEKNNERRKMLTDRYRELFQESGVDITVPFSNHRGTSACHILPVLLPRGSNTASFTELMKLRGIQTSKHYPPIHTFRHYSASQVQNVAPALPVTEDIAAREVTLPLFASMPASTVQVVVQAAHNALQVRDHHKGKPAAAGQGPNERLVGPD